MFSIWFLQSNSAPCNFRGAGDTEDDEMADGEFQIITECWVEPQTGTVVNSTPERVHLEGMDYLQLAKGVSGNQCCLGIYVLCIIYYIVFRK